jgi:hypothetical protein
LTAYQESFLKRREAILDELARDTLGSAPHGIDPTALDRLDTTE